MYADLNDFLADLDKRRLLARIADRVSPDLEIAAVTDRVCKTPNGGPVNVRLIGRNSKVYYVLGQVNAPGSFPLQGRETVLDGLVAAGGLNVRASRSNIILSRPTAPDSCRIVLPVCYRQIVQLGDTTTNYQLQPGDRIYVPGQSVCESIFGDKDENKGCSPCMRPQTSFTTYPALVSSAAALDMRPSPRSRPVLNSSVTPYDRACLANRRVTATGAP